MKTTLLLIITCFFACTYSYGQKLEISVQVNTGISRFSGESVTGNSKLYHMPQLETTYTSNPYGDKIAAVYGVSAQLQRISVRNFIVGAQLGVESLKGRVNINWVDVYDNNNRTGEAADGTTTLRYDFVNLQPYIGRRFETGKFYHDLTVGTDLGLCLNANEKTNVSYGQNKELKIDREISVAEFDVRPRVGVTSYYQNFGLSVSYAHGLTDYRPNLEGTDTDAYMRILRLGLIYKIK